MKFIAVFLLLGVLTVSTSGQNNCLEQGSTCSKSTECCTSYCRSGRCIRWGDVSDDEGSDPCSRAFCAGGPCIIQQVQCVRAPCPGIARCARNE